MKLIKFVFKVALGCVVALFVLSMIACGAEVVEQETVSKEAITDESNNVIGIEPDSRDYKNWNGSYSGTSKNDDDDTVNINVNVEDGYMMVDITEKKSYGDDTKNKEGEYFSSKDGKAIAIDDGYYIYELRKFGNKIYLSEKRRNSGDTYSKYEITKAAE